MKFEQQIYYKLFTLVGGSNGIDRISYACRPGSPFRLDYSINKITRSIPGSMGIFVFDTRDNARRFVKYGSACRAFKCLIKGPVIKVDHLMGFQLWGNDDGVNNYKKYVDADKKCSRAQRIKSAKSVKICNWNSTFSPTVEAPQGTFSVAAVKPIEEVWINEV